MPDRVRYVMRKDESWDAYLRDLISDRGYGRERVYAGISEQERAETVRRKLRTAGKHLGVSVKAFWEACDRPGRCSAGSDCRWHVRYSAFRPDDARTYKARVAKRTGLGLRHQGGT